MKKGSRLTRSRLATSRFAGALALAVSGDPLAAVVSRTAAVEGEGVGFVLDRGQVEYQKLAMYSLDFGEAYNFPAIRALGIPYAAGTSFGGPYTSMVYTSPGAKSVNMSRLYGASNASTSAEVVVTSADVYYAGATITYSPAADPSADYSDLTTAFAAARAMVASIGYCRLRLHAGETTALSALLGAIDGLYIDTYGTGDRHHLIPSFDGNVFTVNGDADGTHPVVVRGISSWTPYDVDNPQAAPQPGANLNFIRQNGAGATRVTVFDCHLRGYAHALEVTATNEGIFVLGNDVRNWSNYGAYFSDLIRGGVRGNVIMQSPNAAPWTMDGRDGNLPNDPGSLNQTVHCPIRIARAEESGVSENQAASWGGWRGDGAPFAHQPCFRAHTNSASNQSLSIHDNNLTGGLGGISTNSTSFSGVAPLIPPVMLRVSHNHHKGTNYTARFMDNVYGGVAIWGNLCLLAGGALNNISEHGCLVKFQEVGDPTAITTENNEAECQIFSNTIISAAVHTIRVFREIEYEGGVEAARSGVDTIENNVYFGPHYSKNSEIVDFLPLDTANGEPLAGSIAYQAATSGMVAEYDIYGNAKGATPNKGAVFDLGGSPFIPDITVTSIDTSGGPSAAEVDVTVQSPGTIFYAWTPRPYIMARDMEVGTTSDIDIIGTVAAGSSGTYTVNISSIPRKTNWYLHILYQRASDGVYSLIDTQTVEHGPSFTPNVIAFGGGEALEDFSISDSQKATFACKFTVDTIGSTQYVFGTDTLFTGVFVNSSGVLGSSIRPQGESVMPAGGSTVTTLSDGDEVWILFAIDLTGETLPDSKTGIVWASVNGGTPFELRHWTQTSVNDIDLDNLQVGRKGTSNNLVGDMEQWFWATDYRALDPETHRDQFFDSSGNVREMASDGVVGDADYGTPIYPQDFINGAFGVWNLGTNDGLGGTVTPVGTFAAG